MLGWQSLGAGYRRTLSTVAPVFVSLIPLALLFGALAVDNGLTIGDATLMSALVFAGASQMVGIELYGQDVPAWVVIFSVLAVNFRHVLYSASIGSILRFDKPWKRYAACFFMVDPMYALAEQEGEAKRPIVFAEYMFAGLLLYIVWVAFTVVGAMFGNLLENPSRYGIDFLLPLYFMALVMGFRKRPLWLSVVAVSGAVSYAAYLTIGSPWHVSVGALAGVAVGAIWGVPKEASDDV